jgi:23S rRNA (cytosine1962-C5)-methyltransferase
MKLQFKQSDSFIIVDKPAGFSTHSPDQGKLGICEIYEKEVGHKLFIAQRLDKTTTGSLVLAESRLKAAELTELFQSRQVQKKYLFITASRSQEMELKSTEPIEGKESETHFRRLKRNAFFELWEATPLTGRAHQIRIHASLLGLPILGDVTYKGAPYPHLCLHAQELRLPGLDPIVSPAPVFMDRMGLLRDRELVRWLSEIDRRQRLYGFLQNPEMTLRLIHLPDLRLDLLGPQLWFYWYRDEDPTSEDLERCEFVAGLLKKRWLLRKMQNRGEDPNKRLIWSSIDWQEAWTAKEENTIFQFYSQNGQSPGLFLDQRANRRQLQHLASQKKVLNLFAYTCGFSVAAAISGASEVTSVDLSSGFLKWGQQNFSLNELDPTLYNFFHSEAQLFLKGAIKRQRKFDLIVCDPPSFGRHKDGVFRLDQALPELLNLCWQVLAPQGHLLFSCNLEKWDREKLKQQIQKNLSPKPKIELGCQDWDFELPNEETLMKSFWVQKI